MLRPPISSPKPSKRKRKSPPADYRCRVCRNRISAKVFDNHDTCAKVDCRGKICDMDDRCVTCSEWPDARMYKYLQHQKLLSGQSSSRVKYQSDSEKAATPSNFSGINNPESAPYVEYDACTGLPIPSDVLSSARISPDISSDATSARTSRPVAPISDVSVSTQVSDPLSFPVSTNPNSLSDNITDNNPNYVTVTNSSTGTEGVATCSAPVSSTSSDVTRSSSLDTLAFLLHSNLIERSQYDSLIRKLTGGTFSEIASPPTSHPLPVSHPLLPPRSQSSGLNTSGSPSTTTYAPTSFPAGTCPPVQYPPTSYPVVPPRPDQFPRVPQPPGPLPPVPHPQNPLIPPWPPVSLPSDPVARGPLPPVSLPPTSILHASQVPGTCVNIPSSIWSRWVSTHLPSVVHSYVPSTQVHQPSAQQAPTPYNSVPSTIWSSWSHPSLVYSSSYASGQRPPPLHPVPGPIPFPPQFPPGPLPDYSGPAPSAPLWQVSAPIQDHSQPLPPLSDCAPSPARRSSSSSSRAASSGSSEDEVRPSHRDHRLSRRRSESRRPFRSSRPPHSSPRRTPSVPPSQVAGTLDEVESAEFQSLVDFVFSRFPSAKGISTVKKTASFSFLMKEDVQLESSSSKLNWFYKLRPLINDLKEEVSSLASSSKSVSSVLYKHRRAYCVSSDEPSLLGSTLNDSFNRICYRSPPSSPSLTISSADVKKIEQQLHSLRETVSFQAWMVATLFVMLDEANLSPPDDAIFKRLKESISTAVLDLSCNTTSVAMFFKLLQRSSLLKNSTFHKVTDLQKTRLLGSDPFSAFLFDEKVLKEVADEFDSSSAAASHLRMEQALTKSLMAVKPRKEYSSSKRSSARPSGRSGRSYNPRKKQSDSKTKFYQSSKRSSSYKPRSYRTSANPPASSSAPPTKPSTSGGFRR